MKLTFLLYAVLVLCGPLRSAIVPGHSLVVFDSEGAVPIIKQFHSTADIPQEKLLDWSNVFELSRNHFFFHKSILSQEEDEWVEIYYKEGKRFIGKPIHSSTLLWSPLGGSAMISFERSTSITKSYSLSAALNILIISLGASKTVAIGTTLTESVDVSCSVPPETRGGVYMFEPRIPLDAKYNIWKFHPSRFRGGKYKPTQWVTEKNARRTFENPIFVCSTDGQYLDKLDLMISGQRDPLLDYSHVLPAA